MRNPLRSRRARVGWSGRASMVNHLCPGLPCPIPMWWLGMVGVEMGEDAAEEEEGGERMGLRCWPPPRLSRRLMSRPLKWALIYIVPLLMVHGMGSSFFKEFPGCLIW